ncbi:MAG: methyltransferase domain-containing protein [Terrisporobacter sp.]
MNRQIENNIIKEYLNKINLEEGQDYFEFLEDLRKKHGNVVVNTLNNAMTMRNGNGNSNKIYKLKNASLELSIDFTAYSANLYKSYFEWLIKNDDLNPKNILDLGCDNGIVTCFYALLYPNAKVIGVDKEKKGVECGIELAKKLNLTNVEFKVMDGKKLDKSFDENQFDLVVSVRSVLEMIMISQPKRVWTLEERLNSPLVANSTIKAFKSIKKIMSEDGKLITFERLGSMDCILNFANILSLSGLYVDLDNFAKIQFHELGEEQEMPLLIFTKTKENNLIELVDKYSEAPIINKIMESNDGFKYELQFNQIENKELLFGCQINYADNSGNQRDEIWKYEDQMIYYKYTNTGYRELEIEDIKEYENKKNEIIKSANFTSVFGSKTHQYSSIDKRELIK